MAVKIDFARIAARALATGESLVRQWIPGGKREGYEYKALNPTRSDSKIGSFSINLTTGAWSDFATGDRGGDLVSLYAYVFGLEQGAAAREVADQLGIPPGDDIPAPPPPPPKKPKQWTPLQPAPVDAPPPPLAHYVRGIPQAMWRYCAANGQAYGFIYKYTNSSGDKEILPLTYCENAETGAREWRWIAFAEPRPLYGLEMLAAYPDMPVLLVEGEKCVDAARLMLRDFIVVTWPGGSKAVDKVDWSPLYGRTVYAWPDADAQREKPSKDQLAAGMADDQLPLLPEYKQPGVAAMIKIGKILAKHDTDFRLVRIPPPGEKPGGWDIADAVADGMDTAALHSFIHDEAVTLDEYAATDRTLTHGVAWDQSALYYKNHELVPCLANLYHILRSDPRWKGVLAFNAFAYQVMKLSPPPYEGGTEGEWTEQDDNKAAIWLTDNYRFAATATLTADAVEAVAADNSFHPVQDYLRSLVWDGVPRVDDWITTYVGAKKTEYVWRVARWFLIGMVARAMEPGVKFDCCLVFEGEQGRRKSMAFRVLGGEWFGDTDLDLHNKDSMSAIRGKWVYEFAELGSIARSEATRQKSFLSRQVDEFRPVYGRREIRSPRQCVFVGTTNDWEWNKDSSGGRRFWPIECKREVDYKGLEAARDQLFAEAFKLWSAGERFWPTTDEQRDIFDDVQMARNAPETLVDLLHDWVMDRNTKFFLADAAFECLKLDASKLTRDLQTRIGNALKVLGCTKARQRSRATFKTKVVRRSCYNPPKLAMLGEEGDDEIETRDKRGDDEGVGY